MASPTGTWRDAPRQAIARHLGRTFSGPEFDPGFYRRHPGDPGLLGPGSAAWRVHADFPSMLVGGVSALLLQTLHPLAMAGVADHSDFHRDPVGRLRRTGAFVAVTTYAAMPLVEEAVARVRRVHERVVGRAPDGRPYAAGDPALLCWVHVAEVDSFCRAYQRYGGHPLTSAERDAYYREVAVVAERLGASGVPRSVAEIEAYHAAVRPELAVGAQAREAVRFVVEGRTRSRAEALAYRLVARAAVDLLPRWAQALHALTCRWPERLAVRTLVRGAAEAYRLAVGPSVIAEAARARYSAGGQASPSHDW